MSDKLTEGFQEVGSLVVAPFALDSLSYDLNKGLFEEAKQAAEEAGLAQQAEINTAQLARLEKLKAATNMGYREVKSVTSHGVPDWQQDSEKSIKGNREIEVKYHKHFLRWNWTIDDTRNYHAYDVESYALKAMPPHVIINYNKARKAEVFDHFEVWERYEIQDLDPYIIGVIKSPVGNNRFFLIDSWAEDTEMP